MEWEIGENKIGLLTSAEGQPQIVKAFTRKRWLHRTA